MQTAIGLSRTHMDNCMYIPDLVEVLEHSRACNRPNNTRSGMPAVNKIIPFIENTTGYVYRVEFFQAARKSAVVIEHRDLPSALKMKEACLAFLQGGLNGLEATVRKLIGEDGFMPKFVDQPRGAMGGRKKPVPPAPPTPAFSVPSSLLRA